MLGTTIQPSEGHVTPVYERFANDLASDSGDSLTEAMMQTNATSWETHNLIASDRVEGTPVRSTAGSTIGTIERMMIDKFTGNVAYAVLSFNGSVAMGKRHLPIPWSWLTYDRELATYHLDLTEKELTALSHGSEIDWGDRGGGIERHDHDSTKAYWGIAETW
jgi:PRC-barrel domain